MNNKFKFSLITLGCSIHLSAIAAPLYVIQTIHTPPTMVVSGQEAIATYKVSTQLTDPSAVKDLPRNTSQIVDGEAQDCTSPNFTLTPSNYCLLHLKISAQNLGAGQTIISQSNTPLIYDIKNPSFYTPIPGGINTQIVDATNAQLPQLAFSNNELIVSPDTTTDITINNSSQTEINNLHITLPDALKPYIQTTSNCTYIAANSSCKITFTVSADTPQTNAEAITIQAANTAPYTVTFQNNVPPKPPTITVSLSPATSKHLQYQAIEVKNISDTAISLTNIAQTISDEKKLSFCDAGDATCENQCSTGETLSPNSSCLLWVHSIDDKTSEASLGKETETVSIKVTPSNGAVTEKTFNLSYKTSLYIGGFFTKNAALTQSYNHIANWDGASLTAFNTGLGSETENSHDAVYALAMYRGDLYAAGDFASTFHHIARWDVATQTWQGLTPTGANQSGLNEHAHALAVLNDELYVGGVFTGDNNSNRLGYITRWDGKKWNSLPYNQGNGVNAPVHSLLANGADLYVGGQFNSTADNTLDLNHIARWSITNSTWNTIQEQGSRAAGLYGDTVRSLAIIGDTLYMGGAFSYYGCDGSLTCRASRQIANNIIGWNINNQAWQDFPAKGLNDSVLALTTQNNSLFAGGTFTATGDDKTKLSLVGLFNGTSWTSLTANAIPDVNPYNVNALSMVGDQLFMGGQFITATDKTTVLNNIAVWNSNTRTWEALMTGNDQAGFNAAVQALMIAHSIAWE